jgi:SAM-dependent methyltransferase
MDNFHCVACGEFTSARHIASLSCGSVRQCRSCGAQSIFPLPSAQDLIAAYQNFNAGEIGREEFSAYTQMAKEIIKKDLKWLDINSVSGLNFLDYGCGAGHFVLAASQLGLNAFGIDIDEEDAKFGKQQGIQVAVGDYHDLNAQLGQVNFDMILMMHVLEHMPNPFEGLQMLVSRLNPNGALIIRVPDQNSVPSRIKRSIRSFGIRSECYGFVQPPIHLHGFSKQYFEYLSDTLDLEIVRISKVSALDVTEFPSTQRYWRNLSWQKLAYWVGCLIGSGGYITAILRKKI